MVLPGSGPGAAFCATRRPVRRRAQGHPDGARQDRHRILIEVFKEPLGYFLTNCLPREIAAGRCNEGRTNGWFLDLAPDIDIETGSEDTFQSIVAKVTGNYVNYGLIDPAEVGLPPGKAPTVNYGRLMHVFPISAGMETTRHADAVNGIVEIGYMPYDISGPLIPNTDYMLGVNPKIGLFVQGGYKFKLDDALQRGGARDESGEALDDPIGRLKLSASWDIRREFPFWDEKQSSC